MRMHLALNINIPNRATLLIEYLVVLIFRFITQFIKTNKIGLTVVLCRFKDIKDTRQFLSIFKDQGHSEILRQIQGRFLTFKDVWQPYLKRTVEAFQTLINELEEVKILVDTEHTMLNSPGVVKKIIGRLPKTTREKLA